MFETKTAAVADLHIDRSNPRVPEEHFQTETAAISYLIDHADVNELVQSIGRSGWLDFEPLIVLAPDNIVIEGNRRLAALRLLGDPALRTELSFRLPPAAAEDVKLPDEVRVIFVNSRADARAFIGFKHINGAYKWDSFAKAKYANEWLAEDSTASVRDVSEQLGDSHNTVLRLVNGYRVLRQAEKLGFDTRATTASRGFSFSHLYTALPSPAIREYLGISRESNELFSVDPVPDSHREQLRQYMLWLYGQQGQAKPVVASQNPDLGRLTKVISNTSSRRMLESGSSLDQAYDMVEEKGKAFQTAIYSLLGAARETASQVGKYDGDPEVLQMAELVEQTVHRMVAGMKTAVEGDSGEDKKTQ